MAKVINHGLLSADDEVYKTGPVIGGKRVSSEEPTYEIDIPQAFAMDHSDRDLETGEEVARKGHLIRYRCTLAQLKEWKSDAVYYSDCAGEGWCIGDGALGLQSSARATVRRVNKLLARIIGEELGS